MNIKYNKSDKLLISSFTKALREIESLILKAMREKNIGSALFYQKKAEKVILSMKKFYKKWSLERGLQEYLHGLKDAESEINNLGKSDFYKKYGEINKKEILEEIGVIHKEAIENMVGGFNKPVFATLDGVNKDIGYSLVKFSEQKIREKMAEGVILGEGLYQTKKKLVDFFGISNIGLIKDRGGKRWNSKTYAEMLIRTETARAYNQGKVNRAVQLGYTKFKVVEKDTCCSLCAGHNGKVIDISKGNADLPPYHPNCMGSIDIIREEKIERHYSKFETRTKKLAKKHGIEGGNTLSKMKRLNKIIIKGKGFQTKEDREIYKLKEDYLLHKIIERGKPIKNKGKKTTFRISEGKVKINWHISYKLKEKLKQKGLLN